MNSALDQRASVSGVAVRGSARTGAVQDISALPTYALDIFTGPVVTIPSDAGTFGKYSKSRIDDIASNPQSLILSVFIASSATSALWGLGRVKAFGGEFEWWTAESEETSLVASRDQEPKDHRREEHSRLLADLEFASAHEMADFGFPFSVPDDLNEDEAREFERILAQGAPAWVREIRTKLGR